MTKTLTLRSLDVPSIYKFGVGFDRMFDDLMRFSESQTTNYPPHNIIQIDETNYIIELAVAGFAQSELGIELKKNILTIKGSKVQNLDEPREYLVRGISNRNFERSFPLAEHVEVQGADLIDGVLSIKLTIKLPEDHLPKRIDISYHK